MTTTYSIHETGSRFGEVLDLLRQGETVTVVDGEEPIAEITPAVKNRRAKSTASENAIQATNGRKRQTIEERIKEMRRNGTLVSSGLPKRPFRLGEPAPGALERFLAER